MRKSILSAAVVVGLAAPALASTWEIDGSHTSATFAVRHMMVTDVRGEFGKVSGVLSLDDKDVTRSSVDVAIDATTINTRDQKRDAHLRSPDFFDVEKHPTITFKSTKVEKAGANKLKVTGNLTMRGVTKPVTLDVDWTGQTVKDPWGNEKAGATATAKINRKDWGLNWNKALEAGGLLVGEEVTLHLGVSLNKKSDSTQAKK